MKRPVISHKNFAPRLHVVGYCVIWLMLDRLSAPGWAWGVAGSVVAFDLLATVIYAFKVRQVDVFEKDTPALGGASQPRTGDSNGNE
jgi:hypothetical protein